MSSAVPSELSAAAIISHLEAEGYPREVMLTMARGFMPLPQEELITVLAFLILTDDPEIAGMARTSLADMPARIVQAFAANDDASPVHLSLLAKATVDDVVLEALIRNRAVPDAVIVELARRAQPGVQEIIVINQSRILRAPEILDALLENPRLGAEARRRALETREEFFDKKARIEQLKQVLGEADVIDDSISNDGIADLLDQVALVPEASLPPASDVSIESLEESKKKSMWSILSTMSVSGKVQLAFKGNKSVRMILVRERNRLVASAAMRNPRMSESEVEQIAGMRDVGEDVLRILGLRRDWTSKYPIALALVKNPKAPVGVVLPLINRLTLRDLKGLKDDKGVSDAVRANAKKLYQIRQKT